MSETELLRERIKQLEGYFNPPDVLLAHYQGVKVAVIVRGPWSSDKPTLRAQYVEGDLRGKTIHVPYDDLEFIDRVLIVPESYTRGLLDRIKELEGMIETRASSDNNDAP